MNQLTYPPGRIAARKVHEYLTRRRRQASESRKDGRASGVSPELLEAVIDAAFWASLRREEGDIPRLSLALLEPDRAVNPLVFERALPLT